MSERVDGTEKEKPGGTIGRGNHRFAPDFVEQRAEHHGTEEAANCKRQQVSRQIVVAYVKELLHHQRIAEKDSIEEEGLTHHERQSQKRSLTIIAHHVAKNFFERRMVADDDLEFLSLRRR